MNTFVALYRGRTIRDARMVAVTIDPGLVAEFSRRLLRENAEAPDDDPATAAIENGRRRALRLIAQEAGVSA